MIKYIAIIGLFLMFSCGSLNNRRNKRRHCLCSNIELLNIQKITPKALVKLVIFIL